MTLIGLFNTSFNFRNYKSKFIVELSCQSGLMTRLHRSLNLFVTCFHEFRIYEFFSQKKILFSFKGAVKWAFFVKMNSYYIDIFFDLNRRILPHFKRQQEKNRKKKIADSWIRNSWTTTHQLLHGTSRSLKSSKELYRYYYFFHGLPFLRDPKMSVRHQKCCIFKIVLPFIGIIVFLHLCSNNFLHLIESRHLDKRI